LCATLVGLLSGTGYADEAAENTAAARTLGIEGVQLADAGKCPEAIEKLSRAEALHHAPTILGRLGECQVNVGEVVTGTGVAPAAGVPASGAAQSAPPGATPAPIGTAVPQPSGGTTPGGARP